ncbi:MAG: UDP-2,3-diacylglucosamine diphosphatase [Gemmatimonadota bacterium]|jgi:UDP-2,3-diacylglucosamine hydrolase|nr:UDP-2,3-diacylglucosamine diphosphatase [Gemmatimonadota bacterium]
MNAKPAYVVSDIHLGAVPEVTERAFRRFLRHIADHGSELLINGDLFDFWFEYGSVIEGKHFRVLAALAELREAGVPVRFVGGNHDAWGGAFLRDHAGLELLDEGTERLIGGRTALVVHGDGVGAGDLGYRVLKRVIRNPVSITLFRALHPGLGVRLASRVSKTGTKHGTPGQVNHGRAKELREWAVGELERRPGVNLVLAGHIHQPVVEEVFPDRFYVNTGDWINHFTYLTLTPGEAPVLSRWNRE